MKTRLLIIIGIVIIGVIMTSIVGTMQYPSVYNQNCNSNGGKIVGFLRCIYINEDVTEPIPVLDEGYEICLIENGTAKTVSESELQEHLAHGATTGDCRTLFPRPEISSDDVKSTQEHYAIEITGLKDIYIVEERYDFSYIISGYGNSCGSKTVTFPDSNGDTIGSASSASCIANLSMGIFVFDIQKEQGITYGHVEIKNPGTYTITVIFDQPNKYHPTIATQEFRVVGE